MEMVLLVASLAAGLLLGAVYFGGLWWTVRRIPDTRRPGQLLVASWLVRTAVLVTGLYLVMNGDWKRLAAAFLGLLIVRGILIRLLRPVLPIGGEAQSYGN